MSANQAADAIGALSLSGAPDSTPSTPRASSTIRTSSTNEDSDSESSGSSNATIRQSSSSLLSKSKSAEDMRSPSMVDHDDVFSYAAGPSDAEASDANAVIHRQQDQSVVEMRSPQYHPRADRGNEINEYNAQGQLPPEAAIFCANLSNTRSPEELAKSIHEKFDNFGKLYVSVKYDKHHNPYAVMQYDNSDSARAALRAGNRTYIDGRPIRLEQSHADRAVIITIVNGEHIVSAAEAREVLSQYGEIETIMSTDMIPGRPLTLPRGQYVRFAYFLDCRDALRQVAQSRLEYRVQIAGGLEPKRRIGPAGSEIYTSLGPARNNTDSKSIYVGNLPEDCSDNDIHVAFAGFGVVENINLVRKTYPGGALNCFAFVEFASPIDADTAQTSDMWIKGSKLRIESKEYTARRNQRMAFESPPSSRSPITTPPSNRRGYGFGRIESGAQSPPRRRIPFRISPAANAALQERLADNNAHNLTTIPRGNNYGHPMMSPPRSSGMPMASPPQYTNPYQQGNPEHYRPYYESPTHHHQDGGNYHGGGYYQPGGMIDSPPHVHPTSQVPHGGGYTDPGYPGPYVAGPPAPAPNYPPYDDPRTGHGPVQ